MQHHVLAAAHELLVRSASAALVGRKVLDNAGAQSAPAGPAIVHWDRASSRISTSFTFSVKDGRFVKSRQKA